MFGFLARAPGGSALLIAFALGGCRPSDYGCLDGDDGQCVPRSPCAALHLSCDSPELAVGRVGQGFERPRGQKADGALGDVLLSNSAVTAVLGGIGTPRTLTPGGGGIVDLLAGGADDELNHVFQAVGILPDDAARYSAVEVIDQPGELVAAVYRGVLDLRPDIEVVTRYELRPCEPGLRVRTEIYHGGRDPLTLFPADAYFWGDRGVTPFVPVRGGGYSHPELDLETIGDAFRDSAWIAGDAHIEGGAAYAAIACDTPRISGFQSATLSAIGMQRTLLMPGDSLAFERFVAVAAGPGQQRATDIALEVRSQLFHEPFTRLSGRVQLRGREAEPLGERQASLLFSEQAPGTDPNATDAKTPWAEVVPDADGSYAVSLPRGRHFVGELAVLGRVRTRLEFGTGDPTAALDFEADAPGRLAVRVTRDDGSPLVAEAVLVPATPTRAEDVRGSIFGAFPEERCAPYLGPPHGGSPACNRVLIGPSGETSFDVPPGSYFVYVTHGPFWQLARERIELQAGSQASLNFTLEPLSLLEPGVLSADFHVHGGASFDSTLPERDRALSFVAMGVDVIAATDHDVVSDYGNALTALGLADQVRVMPGVETTGQILFLRPPGSDVPKVIGHFNFWPLERNTALPRNGAPDDERLEPGALFDRLAKFYAGSGVAQLNHPFLESELGRDTGYFTALEYDPRRAVPDEPNDTAEGQLVRRPAGGRRNIDFDAQEVMNGALVEQNLRYRAGWFSFLNQGILRAGTANSDSHTLATDVLGYPRNLVNAGQRLASFDRERFNESVRRGEMVGTNGPVIEACLGTSAVECVGPSLAPRRPDPAARIRFTVSAAAFIPVQEVRLVVNGEVKKRFTLDLELPGDPFASTGPIRFITDVALDELLSPGQDGWLVVEAGARLPLVADLEDDDGLPDTTDNNGDGVVDARDGVGKFTEPGAVPEADPRFHVQSLVPGTLPMAFSNPFVIDWAGDGFDPPGLR